MEYVFKTGRYFKTDAQTIGEVCERLEKEGNLTPKKLVDVSRPKNAPLHKEFEWNNSIAAEKYREVQAGYLIRSIEVKITEIPSETANLDVTITKEQNEITTRAFHAVDRDGKGYDSLETISNDEEKTEKLMEICLKDIKYFKEKYLVLRSCLPGLFDEIDKALEQQKE